MNTPQPSQSVGAIVRRLENNYLIGTTTISKYVQFNQYDNINTIDAYLNSKHISGEYDSLGREKPFFNIVKAAVNIWYRATDIGRKDIRILPTSSKSHLGAFLLDIHLQQWMRISRFGTFLKEWGMNLCRYGSVVVKMVEKDGKLEAQVVPWNRIITDTIDFENNLKIEILEFTQEQLRANKSYDQENVEELINAHEARRLIDRQQKDNLNDYVRLYEVHGQMSLATLKMAQGIDPSEGDEDTFTQQMHVVSFVGTDDENMYNDFTLYSGKESKDPYMITHLIKEDGRAMSIGAVESLFNAQWMVNHTQKAIKDQMDLASKVIFQTADMSFISQNALQAIENGDILTHNGSGITAIDTNAVGITGLQSWQEQWQNQAQEIAGTPDALAGNNMPSGAAYRQVAILNEEASSLFDVMTENKGLHLEDMMREYVIPFLLKQMNNQKEIVATLGDYGVTQIQDAYINNEAIARAQQMAKDMLLNKTPVQNIPSHTQMQQQVMGELNSTGTQRFIAPDTVGNKTWKMLFKDIAYTVQVEITNESSDKNSILTSLNTIFQTIVGLGGRPLSPEESFIFNKILDTTGVVSSEEISQLENESAQAQAKQTQNPAQKTPIETINFKDMPPAGQQQMAAQAGIQIAAPQPMPQPQGAQGAPQQGQPQQTAQPQPAMAP